MPAVTADTMVLPRVSAASLDQVERPLKAIITGPSGFEGLGFPVRRTLAGLAYTDTDPFIMMDHMGEIDYGIGEPKGTDWHPHRGFETVTYLVDGQFLHQDSHGGGGLITEGATQWMTAASGILHIETPPAEMMKTGGLFNGFQLWVNLPAKDKWLPPAYQAVEASDVLLLASEDAGALIRVIAGEVDGHRGPGSTHSPITMIHASIAPGERLSLPWPQSYNALVYVFAGEGTLGAEEAPIHMGQTAAFGSGDRILLTANQAQDSRTNTMEVLLLGGEPIGEPMVHYGPFVMNTKDELVQAVEDYQAGRLGVIPDNAIMPHTYRG